MLRELAAALLSFVALTGCYASHERAADADVAGLGCEPSELRLVWSSDAPFASPAASVEVAPGSRLLAERGAQGGNVIRRVRDGVVLAQVPQLPDDAAWSRFVEVDRDSGVVSVREIRTGEPIASVPAAPVGAGMRTGVSATLSRDGASLYVLECNEGVGADHVLARSVRLDSLRERQVSFEARCDASALIAGPSDSLFVSGVYAPGPSASPPRPGVLSIDFSSETATAVFPEQEVEAPLLGIAHVGTPATLVVHFSTSEDGREINLVLRDGLLRRLDSATLERLEPAIPVGLLITDPDSFLPRVASPVAAAGGWLAHLDEGGQVALRAPGATHTDRVELPFPPHELGPNGIGALRFLAGGLVASTDGGTAYYSCEGTPPLEAGLEPLEFEVDVASEPNVGAPIDFAIDVVDDRPTLRWVRIGTGYPIGALGSEVSGWASSTGPVSVEVGVDDGVRSGHRELIVNVANRD